MGGWSFDPEWPGADQSRRELLDLGHRMMLGWTYWSYDPGDWSLSGCEESAGCTSSWDTETEILEIPTPNQTARVELQIAPDAETPATIRSP